MLVDRESNDRALRPHAMVLYLADLPVGTSFRTGSYVLSEAEVVSFAEQFDPQPFHVDPEAAENSIFGELVASGLHTLCLSVRLFVTEVMAGPDGIANLGGLGMDELRWHEPVRPGDAIHLEAEVVDVRPSDTHADRGYVDFHREVYVAETLVMSNVSHGIVERRDAA